MELLLSGQQGQRIHHRVHQTPWGVSHALKWIWPLHHLSGKDEARAGHSGSQLRLCSLLSHALHSSMVWKEGEWPMLPHLQTACDCSLPADTFYQQRERVMWSSKREQFPEQGSCYTFSSDKGLKRWGPTGECQSKESGSVGCKVTSLQDCCKDGCAYAQWCVQKINKEDVCRLQEVLT